MNKNILQMLLKAKNAFHAHHYKQAYSLVSKVNKSHISRTFDSIELEAHCLLKLGKLDKSLALYNELSHFAVNDIQRMIAYQSIGHIEVIRHNNMGAIATYEKCFEIDCSINNAQNILVLCKLYRKQGYFNECEKLANKLKKWSNYFAPALHQLILIAKTKGNTNEIITRTKELSRNFTQISDFYNYYTIQSFLSVGCYEEGLNLMNKVERRVGKVTWVDRVRAEFYFNNKQYSEVIALLNNKLIDALPTWIYKSLVYKLRGQAKEKLGLFKDAFNDFRIMASIVKHQVKQSVVNDDVKNYMALDLKNLPLTNNVKSPYSLAFMVGFPRSGTTLLDTILSTQSKIVMLSEVDVISHVIKVMRTELQKQYPKHLLKLTTEDINLLREAYYRYVEKLPQAQNISSDSLVVDKMPLNTIHIPLILLLFPDAKLVFSLRHPLDVCLSNFQQDYVLNQEMYYLIELEDCAKRYNQVFTLFENYRNQLNLKMHFVRYEDLVENMSEQVLTLFKYLDVSADDRYLEFHKLAEHKFIQTPSRDQVKAKLYRSSINKWHDYAEHLSPIIPLLQTHILRYGYLDSQNMSQV